MLIKKETHDSEVFYWKKKLFCSESRKYHVLKDIIKITIVKKILKEEKNI